MRMKEIQVHLWIVPSWKVIHIPFWKLWLLQGMPLVPMKVKSIFVQSIL